MRKVVTVDLHQTVRVDDELEIKAYYAGHVLGAVRVLGGLEKGVSGSCALLKGACVCNDSHYKTPLCCIGPSGHRHFFIRNFIVSSMFSMF